MFKSLFLIIFILPLVTLCQVKITGRVINQLDTKPVPNASVFLSNATIGDHTAANGTFTLKDVRPGKYELVISLIGFERYTQSLIIDGKDITLPDITLYPKTITLNEVKIKPKSDPDRKRNFDWFKDEFLGKSELAKACKIINPEMLDLSYDERSGVLTGSSVDFLIIENNALGYRLKYLLQNFTLNNYDENNKSFSYAGAVFFERLAGTPQEEERWRVSRQEVYENSQLHFLRAALNNKIEDEGFRVFRLVITRNAQRPPDSVINENIRIYNVLKDTKGTINYKDSLIYWQRKLKVPAIAGQKLLPEPLTKSDMFKASSRRGLFEFTSGGTDALLISYNKYHHFSAGAITHLSDKDNTYGTLVSFNEPVALFDNNGAVINPRSLSYEGVWSRNRVATLLPVDYEPTEEHTTTIDSALVNKIDNKFNVYAANHVGEKAYLHFDKPYYAAGDTIYFKAYVTNGEEHRLTDKSGVLYVNLIGLDNKINKSITLQLNGGTTWGDFVLADSLKKGNYRVRAYTNWMRNEGDAAFFDQGISIGSFQTNKVPESGTGRPVINSKPAIQFFPEGGSFVAGIRTKIAFKALAANGLGMDVKGTIIDQNGKEVGSFVSAHLGMGYFYLSAAENQTYRAKLAYANGTQDVIQLPRSEAKGIAMDVTEQPRSYTIRINSNKAWYKENRNKTYTLITYSGGKPYSVSCKLENPEVTLTLSKKDLRTGIAKATLFSSEGEPMCERLLFVQNDDLVKLNISSDKAVYSTRGKVEIQLSTAENTGGHYSASVIDEGKVAIDENTESTIINNLLLTLELKGYIEQPNYYFIKPTDKTNADLDLVMLTHGYRRFEWRKVLEKDISSSMLAFRPEPGLQISGILKRASGKHFAGSPVSLFSRSNTGGLLLDTLTDGNGRFTFDKLTFKDSTKFVIQAQVGKEQNDAIINLDSLLAPTINSAIDRTSFSPKQDEAMKEYTLNSNQFFDEQRKYGINKHEVVLKEVVIKGQKKEIITHSANFNGSGAADQVITAKDLDNFPCQRLYDCLVAKLSGIAFYQGELYVKRLQNTDPTKGGQLYDNPMAVIVDGTFDDYNTLHFLSPSDVEGVEVLMGPHFAAIYGSRAAGGVIIITTKRARKLNEYYRYAPGVVTYMPKGFYKARQFYSPQYDNPHTNQKMTDLRSTIYWNPNIITDKDGKASFSYFNADGKGTYRVVIEGIDADGNLERQVFRYKVE